MPATSRRIRRHAIAAIAVLGAVAAYAASSPAAPRRASAAAAPAATVKIALDYTANVDYLGIYAAITKGYFAAEGITPVILPYANLSAEQLIQAGKTDLGISYPPDVIINNATGHLAYRAVGALVTDNTTALAVLASSKYTRPAQLNGKLYGGFGIASDKPIVTAILRADGVKHPVYRQVIEDASVITALAAHRIDYTAVFGGIDDVTAALQGTKLRLFPYSRYLGAAGNYPNAVFVASDKDIAARGPVLRRAIAALAKGYEWATAHPAAAEAILIADNHTALSNATKIIDATGNATAPHFLDSAGVWGPQSNADYAGLERILAGAKPALFTHSPPMSELYTNSLLPAEMSPALRRLAATVLPPASLLAVLVLAWDLAANAVHETLSLPGPWLVVRASWGDRSDLAPAMWATSEEALVGIAIAVLCAVILAIAIDWSRGVRRSVYPLVVISQTVPIIALAPLVVIWFGFGPAPKIVLVALWTFFAVAIGTIQGLGSADPDAMSLLRTMGASRRQILWRVRLPSALPQFFTGLKVSITFAYVSAIFAEYVGATQGLGYYMEAANQYGNADLVFGAAIVTGILTLTLFGIVTVIEHAVLRWRPPSVAAVSW